MTQYRIEVVVDPKGAVDGSNKVERELDKLESKASGVGRAIQSAFLLIGGAAIIHELVEMTDAWTDLNSRVRVAVGSQDLAEETMGRLADVARRTYSDINLTAESFLLNSTALRELGYNTQQQLDYTESLNNALVVSGAKGDRARQVTEALAKAMAFGTLQGENLNTVIQTGGRVAEALAAGLGVSTNELRQLGAEGKITSVKAIEAITSQMEILRTEAESMPATIGDAFVILKNNLLQFVGQADEASGVSNALAQTALFLAGHIQELAIIVGTLGLGFGGQYLAGVLAATAGNVSLTASFTALNAVMAANPIIGFTIAVAALTTATVAWGVAMIQAEEDISKIEAAGNKLQLTAFGKLGDDILRVRKLLATAEQTFESSGGRATAAGEKVEQYRETLRKLTEQQDLLRTGQAKSAAQAQDLQKATDALAKSAADYLADLEQENKLLGLNSREREIQTALLKEIAALNKGDGPKVTEEQKAAIEVALRKNQALHDQANVLDDIRGAQEKYDATTAASKALLDANTISFAEYTAQIEKANAALASSKQTPAASGQQGAPSFIGPPVPPPATQFEPPTTGTHNGPSFEEILANLDKQNQLLTLSNDERERQVQLEALLAQVKESGYPIDQKGIDQLNERIALGQKLEEDNAVAAESERQRIALINQRAQAEQAAIDHIKGPQAQLAETQDVLKGLYDSGTISLEEYTFAMNQAALSAQGLGITAGEGLTAGLEQIQNHLLDVGGAVQSTLVNGFKAGEDALVSFVRTGKADFSGLVDSILDDLARLAIQQLLSGIFGAPGTAPGGGAGGIAGLLGGLFGGARAGGGEVTAGKSYLVGEKGPEIFHTPQGGGNIVPAGETAAALRSTAPAPVVNVAAPNVQIVNVQDPSEIPRAIQTQEGEEAIMNVISRKRQTVKGLTK